MSSVEPDMNNPATVTDYDPKGSATHDGGETVVITGTGFTGTTSVGIGGLGANFTVISDTEIHATAPAHQPAVTTTTPQKLNVFKNSLASDDTAFPEWTWAGQTAIELSAGGT